MAYQRKNWMTGDIIGAAALNNMENGIDAAADWMGAFEDLLDQRESASDFDFKGSTPYTTTSESSLRLVSAGTCAYTAAAATVADIEGGQITCANCAFTKENGYYVFTNSDNATNWWLSHADVRLSGLIEGESYNLIIDCLGRTMDEEEQNLQYGYFLLCAADETQLASIDPRPLARTDISASTLAFTAPGDTVIVKIYPANGSLMTVPGGRCNFNSLWVNRAGAGSAHTGICNRAGTFSGAELLEDLPAGVLVSASPACGVYVREAGRALLRLRGRHAGKLVVCFGDSVTGNAAPPDDYPSVVADELGATVINAGFGGCRLSDTHPTAAYAAFGMCKLAEAVASGNWSLQLQHVNSLSGAEQAAARLDALRAVNWESVDFVTIAYGTNDIQGGVPADSSPTSKLTLAGGLRYALDTLLAAYPHLRVLVLTPIYRYWNDEERDSDEKTFSGGHFIDWVDALLAAAAEYKIPALDLYRRSGLNRLTRAHFFPAADGTHPNALGQRRIGEKVAARLLAEY